jgi:hypothetical protein
MHPIGDAFVIMVGGSWRSNKTAIKFIINSFKGKIEAHKSAEIILNRITLLMKLVLCYRQGAFYAPQAIAARAISGCCCDLSLIISDQ